MKTAVRQRTHDDLGFHTTEQIGPKRHRTPEGFLVCQDVAISRVGWMAYMPSDLPDIKPGPNGIIMAVRDAGTLFHPTTLLSFMGKPVTNEHPPGGVDSRNWRQVAIGSVNNVRQGTGNDSDVMLADLLITDAAAIADIESGKREVSAGYDAGYEPIGDLDGQARQINIRGNHVALVKRGRCGPRCAIGDHSHTHPKGRQMPTATKARISVSPEVRQRALDAYNAALEEEQIESSSDGASHVHIHLSGTETVNKVGSVMEVKPAPVADPTEQRFAKMEDSIGTVTKAVEALTALLSGKPATVPPGTTVVLPGVETVLTGDSVALETSYRAMLADAEVLVPGFQSATFDGKAQRKDTVEAMCATRRKVLDTMYATTDGRSLINSLTGEATLDAAMTCDVAATLFRSAAGARRLINNRTTIGDGKLGTPTVVVPVKKQTIADLNEMHRKMYPAH